MKTKIKLSKADRRILVAKDVLKQLKEGRFTAKVNNYIQLSKPRTVYPDDDVKANFKEIKKCEVCAIGAAIMSSANLFNSVTFEDILNTEPSCFPINVQDLLLKVFSVNQLLLIEYAFEGDNGCKLGEEIFATYLGENAKARAIAFHESNGKLPIKRMRAIMENIIKNQGNFKP